MEHGYFTPPNFTLNQVFIYLNQVYKIDQHPLVLHGITSTLHYLLQIRVPSLAPRWWSGSSWKCGATCVLGCFVFHNGTMGQGRSFSTKPGGQAVKAVKLYHDCLIQMLTRW